jgi:hypothetical protein
MGDKWYESVGQFKYLETSLTIQNSIHEEVKNRLKSGNACYHSVQNLLSSCLLSKSVKIKIQTVNFVLEQAVQAHRGSRGIGLLFL